MTSRRGCRAWVCNVGAALVELVRVVARGPRAAAAPAAEPAAETPPAPASSPHIGPPAFVLVSDVGAHGVGEALNCALVELLMHRRVAAADAHWMLASLARPRAEGPPS